jgi:hypothetical protein
MKPYPKILKPEGPLHWNGYFQWGINLITELPKPTIPLSFFSQVNPCTAERKRWLNTKWKIVNEQKADPDGTEPSIRSGPEQPNS